MAARLTASGERGTFRQLNIISPTLGLGLSQLNTRRLQRAHEFRYMLYRTNRTRHAWSGRLPEAMATDGTYIRRIFSEHQHLAFQMFEHQPTASNMIDGVESSVSPGVSLVGYSAIQDRERIAILYTGTQLQPGWVAFEQPHPESASSRPTLPPNIDRVPRLRVVAGAGLAWSNREMRIHAALEQRGNTFASSPFAFNILEHLVGREIRTVSFQDGVMHEVEVAKSPQPIEGFLRVSDTRVEGSFAIEPMVYREFRRTKHKIWFVLTFDRGLFALPREWCRFWFEVELHEPDGMIL